MPTYTTTCATCSTTRSVRLSFEEYDLVKAKETPLPCSCGGVQELGFDPGSPTFVLKDGESGGWQSKAISENKFRAKRQKVMERRQKDHAYRTRLIPNHEGVEANSWKEARDMAFETKMSDTKDISTARAAASTYDPLVSKETP